ncbi:MAG: DUF1465 family protein [Pseudomonadota bacterium]|nr:DUF1465 family protein [Pseudomonadota bacterium]
MSGKSSSEGADVRQGVTIPFGQKFAESDKFSAIFKEGMGLVEATAAYLDGDGRRDARALMPPASLGYATESMRLTTRLMQLASWLLIRRAVNEGEMTSAQALEEKNRVKLKLVPSPELDDDFRELPSRLQELIQASYRLNNRIVKLDRMLAADQGKALDEAGNPLSDQMARLQQVFAPRAQGGDASKA